MLETVGRARFHIKYSKAVTFGAALDLSCGARRVKCARDCSESSISHKNLEKGSASEHLEDKVGKFQ